MRRYLFRNLLSMDDRAHLLAEVSTIYFSAIASPDSIGALFSRIRGTRSMSRKIRMP